MGLLYEQINGRIRLGLEEHDSSRKWRIGWRKTGSERKILNVRVCVSMRMCMYVCVCVYVNVNLCRARARRTREREREREREITREGKERWG